MQHGSFAIALPTSITLTAIMITGGPSLQAPRAIPRLVIGLIHGNNMGMKAFPWNRNTLNPMILQLGIGLAINMCGR